MAFAADTRDEMLDDLDVLATHASLHTGDPGTTGANEVAGGTPAYARKAITWNPASSGSKTVTATVTFDIPPGVTITHCASWDAGSGGSFVGGGALAAPESYGAQGFYTLNLAATLT